MIQAYARLTLHEFAIEVMMANWLAAMPEDQAQAFVASFERVMRTTWTRHPPDGHLPHVRQVSEDAHQLGVRLLQKADRRSREIRAGSPLPR